jgi:hypothetical protein
MIKNFTFSLLFLILSQTSIATDYMTSVIEAEKRYGLPFGLMQAISKVESNNHPWTLNVNSIPMFFSNRNDLIDTLIQLNTKKYYYKSKNGYYNFFESEMTAINDAISRGESSKLVKRLNVASTDICGMQLNYKWQNNGFSDVVEMTDINKCTDHAAKLLSKLISSYGISKGTGCYHYCKPETKRHKGYVKKIQAGIQKINPDIAKLLTND